MSKKVKLMLGDNLESLKKIPDNSIDSIVTDPPYGLSFMNKKWDYEVPSVDFWKEVFRVLKPGGHVLSFGGTRTYHRMVVNMEDAGFEIRDQIMWIYGSGFPKSRNIGKDIEKINVGGLDNLVQVGTKKGIVSTNNHELAKKDNPKGFSYKTASHSISHSEVATLRTSKTGDIPVYEINNEYEGWGTALKPANEPICLARKPLSEKSVAENVLKWKTGGINVDGCRVGSEPISHGTSKMDIRGKLGDFHMRPRITVEEHITEGRFPANIILECCCDEVIEGEVWRDIKDYENYQVSNFGNIKNTKGEILKPTTSDNGYMTISLYKDKKSHNKLVHRLVAETFIENNEEKPTVNHIDGDKTNNYIGNLEWNTYSENNRHAIENGLRIETNSKPVIQFDKNENFIQEFSSATEASEKTGIRRNKISAACLGSITKGKNGTEYNSKTAGGYIWKHKKDCPCYIMDRQSLGSSRFFYQAKVSKAERNMGLDGFDEKKKEFDTTTRTNKETADKFGAERKGTAKNTHPTLKPINLMTYLCRLVTPPNGIVLDPFMGSGSTGIAAQIEGFRFVGMELDEDYFKIAEARIDNWEQYKSLIKKV